MIKRVCKKLILRGLIEKPQIDFAISSEDNKPMLDVKLNEITATAVLDINSDYTFVPYAIWMRLNLNPNALDNSVTVNNHAHWVKPNYQFQSEMTRKSIN